MSTSIQSLLLKQQIEALRHQYTACDVADALLTLHVPGAGFLPDLKPAFPSAAFNEITIAPVSTVAFAPKNSPDGIPGGTVANIPPDRHWVDLTVPRSIVVISQPRGQSNAVLGGIMALRARVLGAKGVIVSGRVRDLDELEATGIPIWSQGTSVVGAGAESEPRSVQAPLMIDGTAVHPGDLAFCDPKNGIVIIPRAKVADVISILPSLVGADDRVKEEVKKGMSVREAFKKHRA
ncbi:hypothetical protein DSL72_007555 [Monilinia vaccinii-corymbosi]|uniref:DlpA domain-containing protein n=1 Tax=Monilinia vaccinii-corymbosi TaxID=61207 RepID=A0A8A3PHZ7_9HELO|nr:hypothetical protein DSL72_007555 [Monilinia vaccinii-corymbosi]